MPTPSAAPLHVVILAAGEGKRMKSALPKVLQKIAEVLPLTYLLRLTKEAYLHGEYLTSDLTAVAVLAAWGIAGYVVAAKRFSWQPRQK